MNDLTGKFSIELLKQSKNNLALHADSEDFFISATRTPLATRLIPRDHNRPLTMRSHYQLVVSLEDDCLWNERKSKRTITLHDGTGKISGVPWVRTVRENRKITFFALGLYELK